MSCCRLFAAVMLFVSLGTQAHAQAWPTRPVTMVVPFAPAASTTRWGASTPLLCLIVSASKSSSKTCPAPAA